MALISRNLTGKTNDANSHKRVSSTLPLAARTSTSAQFCSGKSTRTSWTKFLLSPLFEQHRRNRKRSRLPGGPLQMTLPPNTRILTKSEPGRCEEVYEFEDIIGRFYFVQVLVIPCTASALTNSSVQSLCSLFF